MLFCCTIQLAFDCSHCTVWECNLVIGLLTAYQHRLFYVLHCSHCKVMNNDDKKLCKISFSISFANRPLISDLLRIVVSADPSAGRTPLHRDVIANLQHHVGKWPQVT